VEVSEKLSLQPRVCSAMVFSDVMGCEDTEREISDDRCQRTDVRGQMSDNRWQTTDIRGQMSDNR
jgi:hypothetical protein